MINCDAMDSPIKLDLSRLSYPAILQVTLPFLPGGVFLCGALVLDLSGSRNLITLGVPVWSKVILGIFAAYSIGIIVHYTTNTLSTIVGSVLLRGIIAFWTPPRSQASKNVVWRKIARIVLGQLAPSPNEGNADIEWHYWHRVLLERFPNPKDLDAARHTASYLFATLFSTGVVLLTLCAFATQVHWSVWMASALATFSGFLGDVDGSVPMLFGQPDDPQGAELAARLLKFLDERNVTLPPE